MGSGNTVNVVFSVAAFLILSPIAIIAIIVWNRSMKDRNPKFQKQSEVYPSYGAEKDITKVDDKNSIIIECLECGTKNQTTQPPQPGKNYRCGKCGASITFLQNIDARGDTTRSSATGRVDDFTAENTSGQGKLAIIPAEIRGWNWGAFFWGWIWGISNKVWIALLSAIPYVGFIMLIVLGVKGNEWAWQNNQWDSIEHFKRTQKKWRDWGIGVIAIVILIWFILFIASI